MYEELGKNLPTACHMKWSDKRYEKYDQNTLNLLTLNFTEVDDGFKTINDQSVKINKIVKYAEWKNQFKYYQDLYIRNPNKTDNEYIVTEAARGPKNYLRIVSC